MPRRSHAAVFSVLLGGATLTMVAGTVTSAQAGCFAKGVPETYIVTRPYGELARETVQYNSTCDGDHFYAGRLKDSRTDGNCATVYGADVGAPKSYTIVNSCTTGGWVNYSFKTPSSQSYATVGIGTAAFMELFTWRGL